MAIATSTTIATIINITIIAHQNPECPLPSPSSEEVSRPAKHFRLDQASEHPKHHKLQICRVWGFGTGNKGLETSEFDTRRPGHSAMHM